MNTTANSERDYMEVCQDLFNVIAELKAHSRAWQSIKTLFSDDLLEYIHISMRPDIYQFEWIDVRHRVIMQWLEQCHHELRHATGYQESPVDLPENEI